MMRFARDMMRRGVSGMALAVVLVHQPVLAQTSAILRASAGLTTPVVTPAAALPRPNAVAPNVAGMTSASARALANQAAATNATSLAVQANTAARASAQALAQTVPNGLVAGGLVPVANPVQAALDPTGLKTWQGASAPVQTGDAAAPTVTITQTAQRALLTWESFNVGRTTTLEFKQQPDWVVVNRIVANINPVTGRIADPNALKPSQILGTIKADGTVIVINQNGIMFGQVADPVSGRLVGTAQINTRSFMASTLEIGAASRQVPPPGGSGSDIAVPTTLFDRGVSFLQSGLLTAEALVSAVVLPDSLGTNVIVPTDVEGSIDIAAGTSITSASGGFVIITAPNITNAGQLRSSEGQVSLQAGRAVFATASSGGADSVDPEIRGLVLSSPFPSPGGITNAASGLIEAPRGLVSLGASATGTITNAGVLTSTTSVARNGKIVLTGAAVTLAPGATIAITPDGNLRADGTPETIPQGADSVAAFKRSVIEIGGAQTRGVVSPSQISIGANALIYAPSARVSIGSTNASTTVSVVDDGLALSSSLIVETGARIDVGGIKDLVVPASRNSIQITPVKRNELRDTPNYRETTTDGSFSLNGATLFVDPRLSGVRADGVAWVGSPLIEAGSYFAQVGVTAAELMTRGGDLTLGVRSYVQGSTADVPAVTVRPGAILDVSGGWLRYEDGVVQTSRLRTADGRIVEVGQANPNDNFVAVVAPITSEQPRFGASTSFANQVAQDFGFETGYTEGRDAGSLTIKASTTALGGTFYADAFAGTRQIATATPATTASAIASDQRRLQSAPSQLPSGGLLKIAAIGTETALLAGGADIIVYAAAGATPARPASEILLSDGFLSSAGLSGLTLQTSGRIDFLRDSNLTLQPDGALVVDAGRGIRFDGNVSIASGSIAARTYEVIPGSVFRADDDLPVVLFDDDARPGLFDIDVNGLLSTRGRWSNDFLVSDGVYLGGAYADGGSISLRVAPRVLIPIGKDPELEPIGKDSEYSADFSGSIHVNPGALLDVSAGGHVRPDGTLALGARGGDVALINDTIYAQLINTPNILLTPFPRNVLIDAPGFITSPRVGRVSSLMPRAFVAEVTIAPGSIAGQGFAGGGSFTLVTPDLNFGGRVNAAGQRLPGTVLPLDFFSTSGFGDFAVTTYNSRLLPNVFSNGITGNIALLDTETATVRSGETLLLTGSLINALLDDGQIEAVRNLATGSNVSDLLGTAVPVADWDRRAVSLTFDGLTEFAVAAGGTVTASDGALLAASKLRNAGTIRLPGGTLRQQQSLPDAYVVDERAAIGVSETQGLVSIFGTPDADGVLTADANGLFDENAPNARGIQTSVTTGAPVLTNAELTTTSTFNRQVYFTAGLAQAEGIRLEAGSVTDVSGASIRNPRAGTRPGGNQKIEGRIVDAGSIETAAALAGSSRALSDDPQFGTDRLVDATGSLVRLRNSALLFTAEAGATIDLGGASDRYDLETSLGVFTLAPVWSNAGRLALNGGGTLAGSTIRAGGGAAQAEGGVLIWSNPLLRQANVAGQPINSIAADQIMAAGFDTFIALGRLTTLGDASLSLGRGFHLTARPYDGIAANPGVYTASLASTGNLRIDAPYIQFSSPQQVATFENVPVVPTGSATFNAATIDIIGSLTSESSIASLTLNATGDVRLTGVQPAVLGVVGSSSLPVPSSITGQFVVNGDLTINAAQIYPTTGTGSLQQDIDRGLAGQAPTAVPYLLASLGETATIRFGRNGSATPAAPWSAGGNLLVQAANIRQDGVLRVPLGRLTLGSNTPLVVGAGQDLELVPVTQTLVLGDGSITSVSANGLKIPYGTTTDLIEYFFTPTSDQRLFAPPAAELRLAGDSVVAASGATVDASGGGELYAYEFAAGVGGSRDVLSRFNNDPFSGNEGLLYPDGRQVYAIVPSLAAAGAALVDPVYGADYAALYSPVDAGRRVYLEAAPGLTAGWYTLLPARYALLPGGMRVVENVGDAPPAIGESAQLRDGSLVVGGRYGVAGTAIESSQRRTFTVQSQETLRKFSTIQLTDASTSFANLATRDGLAVPQLPADAARLLLAPLTALAINTKFLTTPASGGRGSKVDISGNAFEIVVPGAPESPEGVVRLTTTDFSNLNAASLLIGGVRTDRSDGSTALFVTTKSILVANNAANPFAAPEILLAVDGLESSITIADGAVITATGSLEDKRAGAYVITAASSTGQTAIGGVVRVANGPERLLARPNELALANSGEDSNISIGEATLSGQAILLDNSRDLVITDNPLTTERPLITASQSLVLGGDDVFFTTAPSGFRGLVITPELEAQFAAADRLTITTKSIIGFSGGVHGFKDLRLDARGIRPYGQAITPPPEPREDQFDVAVPDLTAPIAVTINAREFGFSNSDIARTPCGGAGTVGDCGATGNSLLVNAQTVRFGSGAMATFGFDASVELAATEGVYVEGVGTLDIGLADFRVTTPYFGDRALVADPRGSKEQPSLGVLTPGNVILRGPGAAATTVAAAPGAALAFGTIDRQVASFSADGLTLRATAGVLDVRSIGSITVSGTSLLATPGYSKTFGDAADQVTISAPGGYLNLVSARGDVDLGGANVRLSVGGGSGAAGTLQLSAAQGKVVLPGGIDANAPGGRASLRFDSGGTLDLAGFLTAQGKAFTGDIRVRTGTGDLVLDAGQTLDASSVRLTADGGRVDIAGTIDTSGINGGAIGLFGTAGVALASTARLDARADGYGTSDTRAATGGTIEIGTAGNGAITVASGAIIDVSAKRTGARLVEQKRKDALTLNDTTTYNYAQSDTGGSVAFRAPVVLDGEGQQTVAIQYSGSIVGAGETSVEAYRVYDLGTLAQASCADADICINEAGQAVLDLNAAPKTNRLASLAAGSIPDFVRNLDLSASTAGLGALATADNFRARPGVQLEYAGDIVLASNWNLGAAAVDVEAAKVAGLMKAETVYGTGLNYVVPGSEAALFNGSFLKGGVETPFLDFVYRVDGLASGEATVLTLRAGGDLDIKGSITDGFFTFGDRSDVNFASHELGGGVQKFQPTLGVVCSGGCAAITTPFVVGTPANPPASSVNILVNLLVPGVSALDRLRPVAAPYSAAANAPGALGALGLDAKTTVPGDPIGSAELFPLLTGGRPAVSSSYRLVGGAAGSADTVLRLSADATNVAPSATGAVTISGDATYRAAPAPTSSVYFGSLLLGRPTPGGTGFERIDPADLSARFGVDPAAYVRFTLTSSVPARSKFFRDSFAAFATANGLVENVDFQYFGGTAAAPNLVATSGDVISRFLDSISADFGSKTDALGYPDPNKIEPVFLSNPNVRTRTLVRTGTGAIEIAAAGDVDLQNGAVKSRNQANNNVGSGTVSAQLGGSAVYTAGHRVELESQTGTDVAASTKLTIDPAFPAADVSPAGFQPNAQGVFNLEPVYASGGGDIRIASGRDVLARRDVWAESFRAVNTNGSIDARFANVGLNTQLWRVVSAPDRRDRFDPSRNIRINPQLFSSGVGALGGGSVSVTAARDVFELTAVSDTSITTGNVTDPRNADIPAALTLISYGGGNVDVRAGRNVLGSQVDAASGALTVTAGGTIASAGTLRQVGADLLRVRVGDATAAISAIRSATIGSITSTDAENFGNTSTDFDVASYIGGQYSQVAGLSVVTNGDVAFTHAGAEVRSQLSNNNSVDTNGGTGPVLPGSLEVAALFGDIDLFSGGTSGSDRFTQPLFLVPSPVGQLRLFAGGDLAQVTLAMDDGDPSLLPGLLSAVTPALQQLGFDALNKNTRRFGFPSILPDTGDVERRRLHNERTTHLDDKEPVRIFADGNIDNVTLSLPKQARIGAGGDITNMVFVGQNITANDITRITAGGDIIATTRVGSVNANGITNNLPVLEGNNFVLGGPGALFVEAGRDLGPFFNSATIRPDGGNAVTYGGGIYTVGNDYNPWLASDGARLYAQFGVGKGAQYTALRTAYVDPAAAATLDGDLFVQTIDSNGNRSPNRDKPIYDTALVGWLVENQPDAITAAFGAKIRLVPADVLPLLESLDAAVRAQFLTDLPYLPIGGGINSPTIAIDRTIASAPVLITGAGVISAPAGQRTAISGSTLVGWLAQNAPSVLATRYGVTSSDVGAAYAQFILLSSLVQQQFLLDRVYFNELAAPSRPDGASSLQYVRGYRAVDLLFPGASGYTANDLGGTVNGGTKVATGNLDLRLAALETQRGGDITILGPGGRVLGGSVVATSTQAARRGAELQAGRNLFRGIRRNSTVIEPATAIAAIPAGLEGILTLRGGSVRGFTDADFLLNQSRLFTLAGGDVTLWSSNGDLNAGQGAKTSANNPPVVVRFNPDGVGTLDQAGTVAGAGIAALQPANVNKAPDVTLIAPVGTVDAGDAGVRASGNVFVAAAQVANADNFKVGGTAFGNIAAVTVDTGAAASANAASAAAAQAAAAVNPSSGRGGDAQSRISVEVLGFAGKAGEDPCDLPQGQRPANCPVALP